MSGLPRMGRRALLVATVTSVVAALAAGPAHAAPGGEILGANAPGAIDGQYLVVLKSDVVGAAGTAKAKESVPGRAQGLARSYGGAISQVYDAALTGFSVALSPGQARKLAAHPDVAFVEQDRVVSLQATQSSAPWGLDRIDQRNLPLSGTYTYPTTASRVWVYVLDTGIRTSHNQFGRRAWWGANFADSQNSDCHGHGTHVAGTVGGSTYGVAKSVRLVAVKVLDCNGNGTLGGVVAGINWVTTHAVKPAVANMSLGGSASSTVDNAVANSIASGVTYVVAAGNSSANACNYSPARTSSAITVGATDSSDARASFSNYGSCVDIFAPGVSIRSAYYTSNSATRTMSGTSMASPHVAGAAALVLSANPSWTPSQVTNYLVNNATTGKVTDAGSGSPNRLLFVVN